MVTVERARLSPVQVEFYRNNGYLTVENVLSAEQLSTAQRIVDELVEQSRGVTANTEAFALEEGHSAETPRLARINAPSKRHPFLRGAVSLGRHLWMSSSRCSVRTFGIKVRS